MGYLDVGTSSPSRSQIKRRLHGRGEAYASPRLASFGPCLKPSEFRGTADSSPVRATEGVRVQRECQLLVSCHVSTLAVNVPKQPVRTCASFDCASEVVFPHCFFFKGDTVQRERFWHGSPARPTCVPWRGGLAGLCAISLRLVPEDRATTNLKSNKFR